ncbi:leucine-rich repeat domain-containing protein [bacterium]|nr:leucine-rich repeat domain-containing protein [bacterium]
MIWHFATQATDAKGALSQLEVLTLNSNQVGDAGMSSLADALTAVQGGDGPARRAFRRVRMRPGHLRLRRCSAGGFHFG